MDDGQKAGIALMTVYGIVGVGALAASMWPTAGDWSWTKDLVNSVFVISAFGSAAGAAAGAIAAQRIAENATLSSQRLREIRAINAALAHVYSVTNTAIGVKKQMTNPLLQNYQNQQKIDDEVRRKATLGMQVIYEFVADLRTFPELDLPTDALNRLMTEKIDANTRALVLFNTMAQTASGLNMSISRRNDLINTFKGLFDEDQYKLRDYYFGTHSLTAR
jgi:hypothetical protein